LIRPRWILETDAVLLYIFERVGLTSKTAASECGH